jgi:hypothetical protein
MDGLLSSQLALLQRLSFPMEWILDRSFEQRRPTTNQPTKMLHPNYVVAEMLVERTVAQRLYDAEIYRLQRLAKARRRSRLFWLGCWLLSQFGHLLVTVGQRLQQIGSTQAHGVIRWKS